MTDTISNSPEAIERAARSWIGKRVQIPVHYDMWMRGARYGVVTGWRRGEPGASACVLVKMDHPQVKHRLRVWRLDWDFMRLVD